MPFSARSWRLIQGQGGSTVVELVVAMPIAIVAMVLTLNLLSSVGEGYQRVENRAKALSDAHVALERMTRELRQADWVYFRNSQMVDLQSNLRGPGEATAEPKLVRYRCRGSACIRYVGEPVNFPPPDSPLVTATGTLLTNLVNQDVFHPQRIDPDTGLAAADFLNPNSVLIRARIAPSRDHSSYDGGDGWSYVNPLEVWDGASLRNNSRFME